MSALAQPVRLLGRYAMFNEVASGGMATVHLGRLLGSAGFARTVVIKRMKSELAENPEFVAMFVDEARLAARIRHPNVVSTLDVVRDNRELFIVMDYVHGESLDTLLTWAGKRGEPILPEIISAIGVHALLGLHAAHEATSETGEPLRLVHRDFSPHNVLVDVDGAALVVDFGVAKAAQKIHKTRDGQVKGKWAYMSPEQVSGEELDRRSDIFAAGIVLWETLTLERLFFHENPARIATDITFREVEPPSARVPHCPPVLDEVVLKALAKEPGDRYPTARAMAEALRKAVPPLDVLGVSSWLDAMAGDVLRQRAADIAAIEKATANMVVIPHSAAMSLIESSEQPHPLRAIIDSVAPKTTVAADTKPESAPDTRRETPTGARLEDAAPAVEIKTTLASDAASAPPAEAPPEPRRTWRLWLVAVLVIAVGIPLAWMLLNSSRGVAETKPGPRASAPASASGSAPPPAPSRAPTPVASSVSPSARASATATMSSPGRPLPSSKVDCTTPYTIKPGGVKVFRKECLQPGSPAP